MPVLSAARFLLFCGVMLLALRHSRNAWLKVTAGEAMTSERQFEANRENAKKSTGPRTQTGKSRSSRNALRHGLARVTLCDAGEPQDPISIVLRNLVPKISMALAADLARERQTVREIQTLRSQMLIALLEAPAPGQAKRIEALDRYEKAARRKQRRVLKAFSSW